GWLSEAVLIEGLLPQSVRTLHAEAGGYPHQWFWDGFEHVDPAKEASAQATRRSSHTTTLAAEYAKLGLDWEQELRQRAKEAALMKELGLAATTPRVDEATPTDDTDDLDEEEAETTDDEGRGRSDHLLVDRLRPGGPATADDLNDLCLHRRLFLLLLRRGRQIGR